MTNEFIITAQRPDGMILFMNWHPPHRRKWLKKEAHATRLAQAPAESMVRELSRMDFTSLHSFKLESVAE